MHNLNVINLRKNNVQNEENSLCPYCIEGYIEDELHILLVCKRYESLRNKYLPMALTLHKDVNLMKNILHSNNVNIISSLSIYLKKVFELRK